MKEHHANDPILDEYERKLVDEGLVPVDWCQQRHARPTLIDPVLIGFLDDDNDGHVHRRELLAAQTKAAIYAEEHLLRLPDDWITMLNALFVGLPDDAVRSWLERKAGAETMVVRPAMIETRPCAASKD
eukprot:315693-Chlamydomonas_euryale.AAC.1